MINTLNESNLHKTLKTLYSDGDISLTEIHLDGKIFDIIKNDGMLVEIQTKNLTHLLPKILYATSNKKKLKIVFPLECEKKIETISKDGTIISKRKSPVKKSIYDVPKELMGIYPYLLNKYITIDIIAINMIEVRINEENKVQSKNGKRRFRKNWNKINKKIEKILWTKTLSSKTDYISLVPKKCLPIFCAKDIRVSLLQDKTLPSSSAKNAHALLWLLHHMELIKLEKIENRNRYYTFTEK